MGANLSAIVIEFAMCSLPDSFEQMLIHFLTLTQKILKPITNISALGYGGLPLSESYRFRLDLMFADGWKTNSPAAYAEHYVN